MVGIDVDMVKYGEGGGLEGVFDRIWCRTRGKCHLTGQDVKPM